MEWEVILKWLPKLMQGATLTLELTAISVIAGLIARSSKLWYVRSLPYAYIFFFRGTPLLIQLFLVYYGLAQFDVVRDSALWPYLRSPFWCAIITMTLHTAAYIAEILRGAIQAVPPGEIEAARALGMSRAQSMRYIILPQAFKAMLPILLTQCIVIFQDTSLVYVIALGDFFRNAVSLGERDGTLVQMLLFAGLVYWVICSTLSATVKLIQQRMQHD